jgi:hypothetical protein
MSQHRPHVFTENYVFNAFEILYEVCLTARSFITDIRALLCTKYRIIILESNLT